MRRFILILAAGIAAVSVTSGRSEEDQNTAPSVRFASLRPNSIEP